ncbi:4-diphosphocytidyl-2-C-methyl-D-erythritol kinase [bacterium HR12]|nr:4-diphosphocytidyl-2-C-methyl-D-erythritol kinase [bacterium HR12]GIV00309.1 MAG: 4-diphosphocytidyl-2-C-methyl-D-erythritol kinase [Actinomycetota bacterium]
MTPRARTVRREARAKVNVFLRVLGARADGYHDLETLVVPISLADVVTVRPADALRVDVRGAAELAGQVPRGGLNLALVAALALADACPHAPGAEIVIQKRIPVAAGLGGGSADAAATLLALNELWGCGLDLATLADLAERIGSDVPAMLAGGPVLVCGRGELVAPAEVVPLWWVLVRVPDGVRSPDAYRWWDEDGGSTGPDPAPILEAAAAGDVETLGPLLFNDLEPPVFARRPDIAAAKERVLRAGALGAVMSGSGSSVVGLARDEAHARALAAALPDAMPVLGPPGGG